MADPITGGQDLNEFLAKSQPQIMQSVDELTKAVQTQAPAQVEEINRFEDTSSKTAASLDAALTSAQDILNRKAAVVSNPFHNFLSFFNPDYNVQALNTKLQASDLTIRGLSQKMNIAKEAHAAAMESIASPVTAAKDKLGAQITGLQAVSAGVKTKKDALDLRNDELATKIREFSDQQLASAKASGEVPAGLADQEILRRRSANNTVQSQELSNSLQKRALEDRDRELKLHQMTPQDLKAAVAKGDDFSDFAAGEIDRRTTRDATLKNLQLAVEKNDTGLIEFNKDKLLNHSSTATELTNLSDSAAKNGGKVEFKLPNGRMLTLTQQEIDTAKHTREESNRTISQTAVSRVQNIVAAKADNDEADRAADNLAKVYGGVVPPGVANQLKGFEARLDVAIKAKDPELLAKTVAEKKQAIDNAVDQIAADKPKPQQEALKEYVKNGVMSNSGAAGWMFGNLNNPMAGVGTGLEQPLSLFSKNVLDVARNKKGINLGNGAPTDTNLISDLFTNYKTPEARLITEEAASKKVPQVDANGKPIMGADGKPLPGISPRDAYANVSWLDYVDKTITQMAQPITVPGGLQRTTSFYGKYLSAGGQIKREFRNDNGSINLTRLVKQMAEDSVLMQSTGQLNPDQNLAGMFIDTLRDNSNQQKWLTKLHSTMDMDSLAVSTVLAGNKENAFFRNYIGDLENAAKVGNASGTEAVAKGQAFARMGYTVDGTGKMHGPTESTSHKMFQAEEADRKAQAATAGGVVNPLVQRIIELNQASTRNLEQATPSLGILNRDNGGN